MYTYVYTSIRAFKIVSLEEAEIYDFFRWIKANEFKGLAEKYLKVIKLEKIYKQ